MYETHRICYVNIKRNLTVFLIGVIFVSGVLSFSISSNFAFAVSDLALENSSCKILPPDVPFGSTMNYLHPPNYEYWIGDTVDFFSCTNEYSYPNITLTVFDQQNNVILSDVMTLDDEGFLTWSYILDEKFSNNGIYRINVSDDTGFQFSHSFNVYSAKGSQESDNLLEPSSNLAFTDLDENWTLDSFFQNLSILLLISIVIITGISIIKSYMKISLGVFSKIKFISPNKEKNLQLIAILSLILIPIGSANIYFCEESHCKEQSLYDDFLIPMLFGFSPLSIAASIFGMAVGLVGMLTLLVGMTDISLRIVMIPLLSLLPWIVCWRVEKYSKGVKSRILYYWMILSSISYLGYTVMPYSFSPM